MITYNKRKTNVSIQAEDPQADARPGGVRVYELSVDELHFDPENVNKGTPEGMQALEDSLQINGFGRSLVLTDDNTIVAGNKTLEKAGERQTSRRVIVVETDGNEIIAHKRKDWKKITDPEARRYALADNRVSETNYAVDTEMLHGHLRTLMEHDQTLALIGTGYDERTLEDKPTVWDDADEDMIEARYQILILCESEQQQAALLEEFGERGLILRALIQ